MRAVSVAGAPGFYIRGAQEIAVLDRNGRFIPTTCSLVRGNVLVWQRGGAYRLEVMRATPTADRARASTR